MLNSNTNLIGNARGLPFSKRFALAYQKRVIADGGTVESLNCVINSRAILQRASLLFIPSGYKAGVAYSELPNTSNGDLTWTRNSTATRTQSNGNIGSVGANVPRLSYMYGSCPSALLEPQRTNLILQSEDLTNASWVSEGVTLSSNSTTAPDGANTADLIQEQAINDVHRVYPNIAIAITSGVNYACSFFVKKDTRQYVRLVFSQSSSTTVWVAAQFDLDNQTFTSGVGSGGGTFVSASITSASNGFYRITLVSSLPATLCRLFLALSNGTAISSSDSRGCNTYSGSTSNRLWAWGGQLESGGYATTYIPTTTATATRIVDAFSRTNIYTNGIISASGGTWYAEFKNNIAYLRDNASSAIFINTGSSPSLNDGFRLRNVGSSRISIDKIVSSISTNLFTTTTDNVKIAIKWNGSTADVFQNGVKVVSATSFTTTAMEFMNGSPQMPIFIQTMALFNTALSDSDCITLTT